MTRARALRIGACLASLVLASCGETRLSRPLTIAAALAELQAQLRAAGAISPMTQDPAALAASVRHAQCEAMTADPEVPLLEHELTVTLAGSFSATGGFSVGNAVLGSGLNAGVTRGQTQQLTLPLTFVALSEIPGELASLQLAPLETLPTAIRARETARVLADRDALAQRIAVLIAQWNPASCPRR